MLPHFPKFSYFFEKKATSRASKFNKKWSTSFKQLLLSTKHKEHITKSSKIISNVYLRKVTVEFCSIQPDTSLLESAKSEERTGNWLFFFNPICHKTGKGKKELLKECSFDINDLKHRDRQSWLQKRAATLVELILALSYVSIKITDLPNKELHIVSKIIKLIYGFRKSWIILPVSLMENLNIYMEKGVTTLMLCGNKQVIHTSKNLQLLATCSFNYVRSFLFLPGRSLSFALKLYTVPSVVSSIINVLWI